MSAVVFYGAARPSAPPARRRALVFVVLLAAAAAALLRWPPAASSPGMALLLPVREVKVEGALGRVDRGALQATIRRYLGAGMLGMDLGGLRAELQHLAWVERAAVRRVLPGTLLVSISEQQPVARWGERQLLGRDGSVFSVDALDGELARLPLLAGPDGTQRELHAMYMRYAPWFTALGLQLAEVAMDARRSWRLTLTQGVSIELGRDRLAQRLQRFAALYRGRLRQEWDAVQGVDLRYTNGLAVRWRPDVARTAACGGEHA